MRKYFFLLIIICLGILQSKAQLSPRTIDNALKSDTVVLKIKSKSKKLIVLRKDQLMEEKSFPLTLKSDSSWKLPNDSIQIRMFKMINIYAADTNHNADIRDIIESKKTNDSILLIFNKVNIGETGVIDSPGPTPNPTNSNLYILLGILGGICLLLLVFMFYFFGKWKKVNRAREEDKNKSNLELGEQLFLRIQSYFPEIFHKNSKEGHTVDYLLELLNKHFAKYKDQIHELNEEEKKLKLQIQQLESDKKQVKEQNALLEKEKEQMIESHKAELKKSKLEIEELAQLMVTRYVKFTKQVNQVSDDEINRNILEFHISFAHLANAIFRYLINQADESNEMNIKLLKGESITPKKFIDQFTSPNEVQYWVVILIKLLEENGIKSIDNAYINGDKIHLKDTHA